jgi:hypothetical protein
VLNETGQNFARANLVEIRDAVSGHVGDALTPAHGSDNLLNQALFDFRWI